MAERLVFDEIVAAERLSAARAQYQRCEDLVGAGVVRPEELAEAGLALREAESQLMGITEKISLRQRFLDGDLAPEDAVREYEISETRTQVDLLRQAYEGAVAKYRDVEERVGLGMIHESELLKARLQLMQIESQLELMELKLVTLQGGTP